MSREGPLFSTLETRNPERLLYDYHREVAGQASFGSAQLLALNDSEKNALRSQPPLQIHDAELPASAKTRVKKEPRTSTVYFALWNRVAVACLGVALAGINITAAVIGMKTSQHARSHSSKSFVAPGSVSTALRGSRGQTTTRLEVRATVGTETSSMKFDSWINSPSATYHESQDLAILKNSSIVCSQEPLHSKHATLLPTTSHMSRYTQTRPSTNCSHTTTTPVQPIDNLSDQTNKAPQVTTYSWLSYAASRAQVPSNVAANSITILLVPSAHSAQSTTLIDSRRQEITATVDVRAVAALDQLSPTNCLQSSEIWKGPLAVDSSDTCDGA